MGKHKNKHKNKQQHKHNTYSYDYNQWYFKTTKPSDIHKVAEQVFGTTKYISYDTFKNHQNYDIMDGYEKNNLQQASGNQT